MSDKKIKTDKKSLIRELITTLEVEEESLLEDVIDAGEERVMLNE